MSQYTPLGIHINTLTDSFISLEYFKYLDPISSILLTTTYLNTLIIYCSVLILILIIVRNCAYIKFVSYVYSFLAFYLLMSVLVCFFECQLGRQRKHPFEINSNFYWYSLTSYVSYLLLFSSTSYMSSSRGESWHQVILYYNRFKIKIKFSWVIWRVVLSKNINSICESW